MECQEEDLQKTLHADAREENHNDGRIYRKGGCVK